MTADTDSEHRTLTPDICVIGAGAAGLSVASTAALLGVPTVLIERGAMGGECLNAGCVPSKTLIAAANAAHAVRGAGRFGVHSAGLDIHWPEIRARTGAVIDAIAPVDSAERYRALGATVIRESARFIDRDTVRAGSTTIRARRFVIATGSAPAIPPIPGLDTIAYLTNETLFILEEAPRRLAIIGGGAIGVEMAQAHRRLGCDVTVIEAGTILGSEDPECVEVIRRALLGEGVHLHEHTRIERITALTGGASFDLVTGERRHVLNASHVLVATGRKPRLDGLGLEAAGVTASDRGIVVDDALRTSNRRIHALGDCIDGPRLTHAAAYQAGLVIRKALFRLPAKADYSALPRVTYCQPEIASLGLSEAEARRSDPRASTLRFPLSENDRARADDAGAGLVKAVIDRKGRILGVTIVAARAGEMIPIWTLALRRNLGIRAIIDTVFAYPTYSEASRRAALQALTPQLRNPWVARLLRWLRRLG